MSDASIAHAAGRRFRPGIRYLPMLSFEDLEQSAHVGILRARELGHTRDGALYRGAVNSVMRALKHAEDRAVVYMLHDESEESNDDASDRYHGHRELGANPFASVSHENRVIAREQLSQLISQAETTLSPVLLASFERMLREEPARRQDGAERARRIQVRRLLVDPRL